MQPLLQKFQTYLYLSLKPGLKVSPKPSLKPGLKEVPKPLSLKPGLKEVPKPGLKSAGERSDLNVSSVKNYLSDINHFLTFVSASIQEPIVQPIHITPAAVKAYSAAAVAANQLSPSSLNRHLSSLRYFGKFLLSAKLCETDPAQNLTNPVFDPTLAQVITRYQKFLKAEDLSKSTIKNYLSDLKKYLLWARKNIKTTDEDLNTRSLI